jgi:phosphate transport system substrate-binding protein
LISTEAELVVHGHARPGTTLTIAGHALAVGPDGGFSLRIPFSEGLADLAIECANGPDREFVRLWFGQLTQTPDPTEPH